MDIRVGRTLRVDKMPDRPGKTPALVEARLLALRAPRRRNTPRPGGGVDRREGEGQRDPVNGRVLVLMIPDGSALPADLADGSYRVFLRFSRR